MKIHLRNLRDVQYERKKELMEEHSSLEGLQAYVSSLESVVNDEEAAKTASEWAAHLFELKAATAALEQKKRASALERSQPCFQLSAERLKEIVYTHVPLQNADAYIDEMYHRGEAWL